MNKYILALLLLALPSLAFAQKNATIPDSDPEVERQSFIVAPGFEVNLFAADPLLAKPIQMNWDPQGRLWVASSEVYPQIKPGEKANDKIVILEDTRGVGKADKTTVFADGLLIPTGVEPGDGGAYVANSTELVHLSATKPGGKADRSRIVLSGFGTEDTHHIIHTFRWGPDSSLFFNQSVYIHSHIETPHGVRHLGGGGVWRFRPDTSELDVFVRGFWNPWGHAFDRWGQSLITDGANGEGITHGIPGAYYPASVGGTKLLHGLNPGSPKHCGLEVLSGRHLPDDWQGNVLTHDFRGHRVCRFVLSDDGSTFSSREMPELIKTNHPAFRPVDVKVGPDGAIYIADWYNPIIQHGEVDFRDPRRDHVHGRIWRVTAKGRPLVPRPNLVGAKAVDLLDYLMAPEDWTRQQVKRVLKERGAKYVLPALERWVAALDPTRTSSDHHRLEALWVMQGLDSVDPKLLGDVLHSADPHARAAAVRVLSHWHAKVPDAAALLAARATDEHPRVRMEAVRALAALNAAGAAEVATTALGKPTDRTLDYALWLTLRELEPVWMPAFQAGKLTFGGDPKRLTAALEAAGSKDAVKPVVALLESGRVAKKQEHGLWLLLARIGGPEELGTVLKLCAEPRKIPDEQRNELMAAVEESVRVRKVGRPKDPAPLLDIVPYSSRPAAKSAFYLIGTWKIEPFRAALTSYLTTDSPADEWQAAYDALARFGDAKAKQTLHAAATKAQANPVIRRAAIAALVGLDLPLAAGAAADLFASTDAREALADLYAAFLRQKGGPNALAKALAGKTLPPDVAKIGLHAVRASVQEAPALTDALTKAGGLGAARKEPTPDEVKVLAADVLKLGDPTRGELVYRRKELQCLACHGIGGAGGQVGPDLTSIGASAPVDYLVESIRIPNKAVKEGFNAFRVVTVDSKVHLGVKVRETKTELVLRTPEDKEVIIPVKDIEEKKDTRSLMPDGIADSLTRQEFADLVRFLSELGKVGPYSLSKARTVRRWQAVEATKENNALMRGTLAAAAAAPDNPFSWSPAYARVSGEVPLAELPKFVLWKDTDPLTVVRCQFDVTTAGPVMLKLNSVTGLSLYVGTTPVAAAAETVLDLKVGLQTLTFLINRAQRTDDLRCELDDVPGSPARAAVVGGK